MAKRIDPRVRWSDPDKLQAAVDEYFRLCELSKEPRELKSGDVKVRQDYPTVVGLAIHLGLDRDSIYNYCSGEISESIPEGDRQAIIGIYRMARQRIEQTTLQAALKGDASDKISMMMLAHWGYRNPDDNTSITVRLIGVDGSDTDKYSR